MNMGQHKILKTISLAKPLDRKRIYNINLQHEFFFQITGKRRQRIF